MAVRINGASLTAWLCNLSPARRRRRRELANYLQWSPARAVANVECPACNFINPRPTDLLSFPCGWCGEWVE